jgi:hypothetical protein
MAIPVCSLAILVAVSFATDALGLADTIAMVARTRRRRHWRLIRAIANEPIAGASAHGFEGLDKDVFALVCTMNRRR